MAYKSVSGVQQSLCFSPQCEEKRVQTCVWVQALFVQHFYQFVNAGLGAVHLPVSADEELPLVRHRVPSKYQKTDYHTRSDTAQTHTQRPPKPIPNWHSGRVLKRDTISEAILVMQRRFESPMMFVLTTDDGFKNLRAFVINLVHITIIMNQG